MAPPLFDPLVKRLSRHPVTVVSRVQISYGSPTKCDLTMTDKDTPVYGTVEHYAEMFGDILADCATGRPEQDLETIANAMAGFERAIIEWMKYHETAIANYRELHRRFILGTLTDND